MGSAVLRGALVRTVPHLTLGPASGVMRRQLLPIHPSPARWAASLWENAAAIFASSTRFEDGRGSAMDEVKVYRNAVNFLQFLKLTLVKPIFDRISASSIDGDDYYIGNIAVNPEVRGKGTGTFLLEQSFEIARKKNCKRMVLDVLFYNTKARAWFTWRF